MTKQQTCDNIVLSDKQQKGDEYMKKVHKPYTKLKNWFRDNNVRYSEVAILIGRTETSVMQKINGYSDFLLSEVQMIKNHYKLNNDIFFTDDVA